MMNNYRNRTNVIKTVETRWHPGYGNDGAALSGEKPTKKAANAAFRVETK